MENYTAEDINSAMELGLEFASIERLLKECIKNIRRQDLTENMKKTYARLGLGSESAYKALILKIEKYPEIKRAKKLKTVLEARWNELETEANKYL